MGQDQSQPAAAAEEPSPLPAEPAPSQAPPPAPSSLEELAAEAMSFSEDNNDSIDVKVQKALECPCVADLKSGPCGSGFIDAFSCFLRSTEEEKFTSFLAFLVSALTNCVKPFIALQNCIKENPEAFSKEILEEEENDEEAEKSNLKVRAPAWSREAKPKL
ncbi:hypothetical protein ACQ4PT_061238 [Festuca glaucescens]